MDYINQIGRADVILRPNVANGLREPGTAGEAPVFLSETAAHAAGVGCRAGGSQRLSP